MKGTIMKQNRRDFLKKSVSTAAMACAVGGCQTSKQKQSFLQQNEDLYTYPKLNIIDEGLKIVSIETFTNGPVSISCIKTDDGSEGWGQLSTYDTHISSQILHEKIAGHFIGKDPAHIDNLVDRSIEANYKYPWSFVCRALTGVDTAVWDLYGKIKKKPVYEILGGTKKPIAVYGSSMRRDIKPQDEAERIKKLQNENGFNAFKIRVGKVNGHDQDQWPGRTEEIIPAVRKAVAANTTLLADGNSCYSPKRAVEVGRILQENGYFFFEEPCPYWELEWTAEVASKLKMNVAGGEQDNDLAQFRRMIVMKAIDIVQPDICYIGGIARAMRIADMALKRGMNCIPHSANLSLVTVFTLHMMAAIANAGPFIEYSIEENDWISPWIEELYFPALEVENGSITIPDGYGWGIEINKDWLKNCNHQISLEGE
jgi:L-alanine-DL-glutamate epimerase-like enolase superfamily enzyme